MSCLLSVADSNELSVVNMRPLSVAESVVSVGAGDCGVFIDPATTGMVGPHAGPGDSQLE